MVISLGGLKFLVVFLRVVYYWVHIIIYINNLPEVWNEILAKIYLYADDAKLYKHVQDS